MKYHGYFTTGLLGTSGINIVPTLNILDSSEDEFRLEYGIPDTVIVNEYTHEKLMCIVEYHAGLKSKSTMFHGWLKAISKAFDDINVPNPSSQMRFDNKIFLDRVLENNKFRDSGAIHLNLLTYNGIIHNCFFKFNGVSPEEYYDKFKFIIEDDYHVNQIVLKPLAVDKGVGIIKPKSRLLFEDDIEDEIEEVEEFYSAKPTTFNIKK